MTPTTPEQARFLADEIALQGSTGIARNIRSLADQVEALTKERDAALLAVDQWRVDYHELQLERDAAIEQNTQLDAKLENLEAAAKLALEALGMAKEYTSALPEYHLSNAEVVAAIEALQEATGETQ